MRFADRREAIGASLYLLHTWPRRYGFALVAVASATLVRYALSGTIGSTSPFLLLYPTVLLISLFCGFGPALFAMLLATILTAYLFLGPIHPFAISGPREIFGLVIFCVMGTALGGVGGLLRRCLRKVQEFEMAMDGLDEMIAVVGRDYRYVIANSAF